MPFYLAPYVGAGTYKDPHRPRGVGAEWSSIDLRPTGQGAGYALVWSPTAISDGQVDELATTVLDELPVNVRNRIKSRTALAFSATRFDQVVRDLIRDRLSPTKTGKIEAWLGPNLVFEEAVAPPALPPSIDPSDDFNRSNEIPVAAPWSTAGASPNVHLASNRLVANGTGERLTYRAGAASTADQYSEGVIADRQSTNDAGPAVRVTSDRLTGYWAAGYDPSSNLEFYKASSGSYTSVSAFTKPSAFVNGDTLRCEAEGSTLRYIKNGAILWQGTDGGTPITGAGAGPGFFFYEGGVAYDSWRGGDLRVETPAIAGSAAFVSDANSTQTITGVTAAVGDLVVVVAGNDGGGAPTACSVGGAGNTFSRDAFRHSADAYSGSIFSMVVATALSSATITVTHGTSGTWDKFARAIVIPGIWDANRVAQTTNAGAATGAAWDSGAMSTTTDPDAAIIGLGLHGLQNDSTATASTPPSDQTELADVDTGTFIHYVIHAKVVRTTGAYKANGTWTGLTTKPWGAIVVAYSPAAEGGGGGDPTDSGTNTVAVTHSGADARAEPGTQTATGAQSGVPATAEPGGSSATATHSGIYGVGEVGAQIVVVAHDGLVALLAVGEQSASAAQAGAEALAEAGVQTVVVVPSGTGTLAGAVTTGEPWIVDLGIAELPQGGEQFLYITARESVGDGVLTVSLTENGVERLAETDVGLTGSFVRYEIPLSGIDGSGPILLSIVGNAETGPFEAQIETIELVVPPAVPSGDIQRSGTLTTAATQQAAQEALAEAAALVVAIAHAGQAAAAEAGTTTVAVTHAGQEAHASVGETIVLAAHSGIEALAAAGTNTVLAIQSGGGITDVFESGELVAAIVHSALEALAEAGAQTATGGQQAASEAFVDSGSTQATGAQAGAPATAEAGSTTATGAQAGVEAHASAGEQTATGAQTTAASALAEPGTNVVFVVHSGAAAGDIPDAGTNVVVVSHAGESALAALGELLVAAQQTGAPATATSGETTATASQTGILATAEFGALVAAVLHSGIYAVPLSGENVAAVVVSGDGFAFIATVSGIIAIRVSPYGMTGIVSVHPLSTARTIVAGQEADVEPEDATEAAVIVSGMEGAATRA